MQDHYDVKMPCHLLLGKLAAVAPAHVMGALEDLIPPLTATLTARPKAYAVKQEVRGPACLATALLCQVLSLPDARRGTEHEGHIQRAH